MKKILFALLFLPFISLAQTDSGTVQFYVYPDYAKIILNNTRIIKTSEKIRLPIGKYNLNISGSKLLTINEELNVQKDSVLVYRKIVPNSVEYLNFKESEKRYRIKSTAMLACAGLAGLSTVYFTLNVHNQAKDKRAQALESAEISKTAYENSHSISDIEKYKDDYNRYKDDYYKYNKQIYYSIPIAIVGSLVTYKLIKIYGTYKKLKFVESISLNFYRDINNANNFTLNYKF